MDLDFSEYTNLGLMHTNDPQVFEKPMVNLERVNEGILKIIEQGVEILTQLNLQDIRNNQDNQTNQSKQIRMQETQEIFMWKTFILIVWK